MVILANGMSRSAVTMGGVGARAPVPRGSRQYPGVFSKFFSTDTRLHTTSICHGKKPKNQSRTKTGVNEYDGGKEAEIVTVLRDGSDAWRLDDVAEKLSRGAVGIVPTDTYPALVCDIENKDAIKVLYELKRATPKKSMSILVRNMSDISTYTLGFPVSRLPGQPDFYKIAKKILPGPYTMILPASKSLPKQIIDFDAGKSKKRSTVGVRLVDNVVCQELLQRLERPLLCSSAILPDLREEDGRVSMVPDIGTLSDFYGHMLAFIVTTAGEDDETWNTSATSNEPSTVLDLTKPEIEVVRHGKGPVDWLR